MITNAQVDARVMYIDPDLESDVARFFNGHKGTIISIVDGGISIVFDDLEGEHCFYFNHAQIKLL